MRILRVLCILGCGAVSAGFGACAVAPVAEPESPVAANLHESRWIFETAYGGGFNEDGSPMEAKGLVIVDTGSEEICFEQDILGSSSAHLHSGDGEIVVTFFEPPADYRRKLCVGGVAGETLQEIVADPESFYIEFHSENSGGELRAFLEESEVFVAE